MPDHRAKNNRRNAAGGLHSIATLQTLANGAKPCERQHMATCFARLENERARLECELIIWEERSRATATKLVKVDEGIAALRPALLEAPGRHGGWAVERRSPRAPPPQSPQFGTGGRSAGKSCPSCTAHRQARPRSQPRGGGAPRGTARRSP